MPALNNIPNFHLKILFLVQLVFISLSTMGTWSGSSYLFYNFVLIILLLWGIHRPESEEPIQMALLVNSISILLDVFLLAFCFPGGPYVRDRFSAAMAILLLISRPFSCIYLARIIQERIGSTGPISNVNNLFSTGRNESYEDIDRTASSQQPGNSKSYDFNSAQQI